MNISLKFASSFLFLFRLVRMIVTVLTVTITAKYFGVSIEKDMWVLVFTIMSTTISALWGPLNETFRTKFVFIKETEGEESALQKTSSLVQFILWISFFLGIIMFVYSSEIASFFNISLQEKQGELFVRLLVLQIPLLLINELTNIGISILNAYEVYFLPEIMGLVTGLCNLLTIIVLTPLIGIFSMLVSTYVGAMLLLVAILLFLNKEKVYIFKKKLMFSWSDIIPFIIFSVPFFFPYFVSQMNLIFEKYFAGLLGEGMISALDYSRQFANVLQGVIQSVLTTIFVPVMAKYHVHKSDDNCLKSLLDIIMVCSFLIGIASVFLISGAEYLCDFFFNRGKVSSENLLLIISLSRYFGFAFYGVLIYLIFGLSLLSSGQSRFYAFIGVINQIVIFVINFWAVPRFGLFVFPFSFGLVHLISGLLMFWRLDIRGHATVIKYIFRSTLAISALLLVSYSINSILWSGTAINQILINLLMIPLYSLFLLCCLGVNFKDIIGLATNYLKK